MAEQRTAVVFLNEKSGSAQGKASQIVELFRGHGWGCEITELRPGLDIVAAARQAAGRPGVVVVSGGGDGTVNAVASAVAGSEFALGVLPVGTLNHFAKDLGLPLELEGAVAVVAQGNVRVVDVCEVNGNLFVNNSSLGFYPQMVSARERLKKVGWNKWLSLTIATLRSFVRFRRIHVTLEVKGERLVLRTPFLFAGNNEYRLDGAGIGGRERLDEGWVFVSVAPELTRMGALRLSWKALRGTLRGDACYQEYCVKEVTVDVRKPSTRVSLDGEVKRMEGKLHYKARPGALRVLAPLALPAKESA